jgi:hypothetical protein
MAQKLPLKIKRCQLFSRWRRPHQAQKRKNAREVAPLQRVQRSGKAVCFQGLPGLVLHTGQ